MKPKYVVVFPEKYTSNGEEKTKWLRCGTLFVDEETKKMALKIESMPTNKDFDGFFNVFPNKPRETAVDQARTADGHQDTIVDDIDAGKPIDLSEIPF